MLPIPSNYPVIYYLEFWEKALLVGGSYALTLPEYCFAKRGAFRRIYGILSQPPWNPSTPCLDKPWFDTYTYITSGSRFVPVFLSKIGLFSPFVPWNFTVGILAHEMSPACYATSTKACCFSWWCAWETEASCGCFDLFRSFESEQTLLAGHIPYMNFANADFFLE